MGRRNILKKTRVLPRRPGRHPAAAVLMMLVAALIVLLPAISWARAGGGEGYSGGGGGGFGGGGHGGEGGHGGGGGVFLLMYYLWLLCIYHPFIGFPLLIGIGIWAFRTGQQGNYAYQSSVIRRGGPIIEQRQLSNTVALIRQHDPNFSDTAFCLRATTAFLKIQEAWTAQDLNAVRAFISDGVYERFSLQFAEQHDAGYRNIVSHAAVQDARVVDARSAGVFDELSVRINASAADYRVWLSNGEPLRGAVLGTEPFVEVWSFLRKRGAVTDLSKTGLIEGNCPNCGAPIEMNQSSNCLRCKAELRSGEYDWVLSEITQESEWQHSTWKQIAGLDRLRKQDPGFDALALEDRASVIFWRRAAADRTGKIEPLRKVASEEFCQAYAAALAPRTNGQSPGVSDCAVGSVELQGFLPGDGDVPFDRVLVEIRWSGKGPSGAIIGRTMFVLGRVPGSQTDSTKSISSAHCPNCGAPEAGGKSNSCEYCHTTLNDGKHGWILLEVAAVSSPRGRELQLQLNNGVESASIVSASEPTNSRPPRATDSGLLAWAVREAAVDGSIDPAERAVLETLAAQRGIAPERLSFMIDAAMKDQMDVPHPSTRIEAEAWLAGMASIALADGKLTNDENALLRTLAGAVQLTEDELNLIMKRARTEQYSQAAAALRGRSQSQTTSFNQN